MKTVHKTASEIEPNCVSLRFANHSIQKIKNETTQEKNEEKNKEWGRQVSRNHPYPAGEMKKKIPRVWESGSFNWYLTQFPASKGGKKSTDTRWSNKTFVPSFMLSVASSFHLVGKGTQYFTGIVSKIQISDFCWRNRHNSKGFFVFFDTRCTNLKIY